MNTKEHLLVCMSEECHEIGHIVSKMLRFGVGDTNVLIPDGPTNQERLIEELNDMEGVRLLLVQEGIIPRDWCKTEKVEAKMEKVRKFMEYAREKETLSA